MTLHSIAKARIHKERPAGAVKTPSEIWCVVDEHGQPAHCATWPEACHEHIADAIAEHDCEEAKHWVVRRFVFAAPPKGETP